MPILREGFEEDWNKYGEPGKAPSQAQDITAARARTPTVNDSRYFKASS